MVFVIKVEGILNFVVDVVWLFKYLKMILRGMKVSFRVNVMNKIVCIIWIMYNRYIV